MLYISQENLISFMIGLLEDARQSFKDDNYIDGNQFIEDVYDYMTIFLNKAKGE